MNYFKIAKWVSPDERKIFRNETENVCTLGRSSYITESYLTFYDNSSQNILVGRFSSLANEIVYIMGGNHPMKNVSTSPLDVGTIIKSVFGGVRPNLPPLVRNRHNPRQVIIGNDVWIGHNVTIMGGVKIGNGAVICANAVVAKDIPPYAIAVGNPARVVKYRFDAETIRKLLAVKWWNWSLEKIADNFPLMNDVEKFLEAHYSPELEEFSDDEFTQKLNNFAGGGGNRFINLSPTSKQLSRCGLRSSKTSSKQSWKTPCLSFGSIRIQRTKTPKL